MDILHVVQGYAPAIGGTERLVQYVSEELVRQYNDRVTVFTTDRYNAEGFVNPFAPRMASGWGEINGVRIRRFKVFNQLGPILKPLQALAYRLGLPYNQYLRTVYAGPIIANLQREILNYPADIVVAASFPLLHMYITVHAARRSQKPCALVGCLHPDDRWGFQRPMIMDAIMQSDRYLALTDYEARYVTDHGLKAELVSVVGAGVDPAPYQTISTQEAKQRLGLQDRVVVGYIGQLVAHKGVDLLLRAMPLVWGKVPDVCLLVAGSHTRYARKLQEILNGWPPEYRDKLTLITNFSEDDKAGLYAALDVFIYPSLYESFGIAYLEAWSAGKPVISYWRGAIPSVVSADHDGLLIKNRDENSLAEAMLILLQNPELGRRMGEAGRRKVLARYTWPQVAKDYREAYLLTVNNR